ncbi:VanZ family protein [Xanthobacteraceae bacterium Astr-EGSB]|uniref:VanZ family protein n=1 Tax=Astrobacterium formosum TaxID=3069710 RepID=UPI0027B669D3|nr:VanZ family protein [Xanthobacteraceae bacterium Astr-EGSB]
MSVRSRLDLRWLVVAAVIGVTAIVVLSWIPGDLRPKTGGGRTLEHACAYFVVAGVLAVVCPPLRGFLAACGLVLIAAVLEIGQLWVPGRDATLSDFLASAAGALLGAALTTAVARLKAGRHRALPGTRRP